MDEFVAVAKSLEIKELCNAETETNDIPENTDEPSTLDPGTLNESLIKQTIVPDHVTKQPLQKKRNVVRINGNYSRGCINSDFFSVSFFGTFIISEA